MLRSVITTSKLRARTASNPSSPSLAVVTEQLRRSSERAMAARMAVLSSTTRMENALGSAMAATSDWSDTAFRKKCTK